MKKFISLIAYLAAIVIPAAIARVDFLDFVQLQTIDITADLVSRSGIAAIHNVIPINVGGDDRDDYLLIDDGWRFVGLSTISWQVEFSFDRQDVWQLCGLQGSPPFELAAVNPLGHDRQGSADLLVLMSDSTASMWTVDLESQTEYRYAGDPQLAGTYLSGIGYGFELDYGSLNLGLDGAEGWSYRDFASGVDLAIDFSVFFGYQPVFMNYTRYGSNSNVEGLIAISPDDVPSATPSATPTPAISPTPTPAATRYPFAALVVNGLGENLSAVSREQPRQIDIGIARVGAAPNRMVFHEDELYVVNSLSNSITVHDPRDGSFIREYATGDGSNPWDLAFVDSERFYVSCLMSNQVRVFTRSQGQTGIIELPADLPRDGDVSRTWARPFGMLVAQGLAYVACGNLDDAWAAGGPGIVCVIDPAAETVTRWFETPGRDTGALFYSPVYPNWLYCLNAGDANAQQHEFMGNGSISVYDLSRQQFYTTLATGEAPIGMALGPDGRGFASNAYGNRLVVFNPATSQVLEPLELPSSGPGDYVSAIAAQGATIWALLFGSDRLYLISAPDRTITEGPYLIGDGPADLVLLP